MRRFAVLTALAMLVLLPPSTGAQMDIDTMYYARIGMGDIPSTPSVEPAGRWNVVETLQVSHDGNETLFAHGDVGAVAYACEGCTMSTQDGVLRIGPDVAAGTYQVSITHNHPAGSSFGAVLGFFGPDVAADATVVIYAPHGHDVAAPLEPAVVLPATASEATIHQFRGTAVAPMPPNAWFTIAPASGAATVPAADGFDVLPLVLGIAAGAALWALLVQRGVVQKRSRKQITSRAAHQEVAASEDADALRARKRLLMAGLKDLEVAKMNKEVEDATYDALKAEWKRETVTVMRALESHE